jgi:RHS repeat-associated protein
MEAVKWKVQKRSRATRPRSDVSSGSVYFLFADHLGSTRAMTQADGTVCFTSEYYPYGQELNSNSSCSTNYKFTGYERDSETNIDYALARYYNPLMGRFMSGDPLGGDPSDPQSHNRYSYTRGNPVNLIDPSGLSSDIPGLCDASMSNCDEGPPDQGGTGSAFRQVWANGMTQYLQQVYNSSIRIGPDGVMYRMVQPVFNRPATDCESSGADQVTCHDNLVVWWGVPFQVAVGQSSGGGNTSDNWWGTFFQSFDHNLLYGMRQPNQSFGDCMNENIKQTTGGHVDPAILYNKAAVTAEAVAVVLGSVRSRAGTYNGIQMAALALTNAAHELFGVGLGAARVVRVSTALGGYGLAIAGGATIGLTLGSAFNCVQPGP